jgi:hypothetical protein
MAVFLQEIVTSFFYGTPGWVRTSGFQLRRLALYPLSYGRNVRQDLIFIDK